MIITASIDCSLLGALPSEEIAAGCTVLKRALVELEESGVASAADLEATPVRAEVRAHGLAAGSVVVSADRLLWAGEIEGLPTRIVSSSRSRQDSGVSPHRGGSYVVQLPDGADGSDEEAWEACEDHVALYAYERAFLESRGLTGE